jgi:hypothetical protein
MGNAPSASSPSTTDHVDGGPDHHNNNSSKQRRSSSSKSKGKKSSHTGTSSSSGRHGSSNDPKNDSNDPITARASKVVGDFQAGIVNGIRKLEEQDHPAAALIDSMCGPYLDPHHANHKSHVRSSYSEELYNSEDDEEDEEDSRTISEEETTVTTDYHNRHRKSSSKRIEDETTVDSRSYVSDNSTTQPSHSDRRRTGKSTALRRRDESSYETEEEEEDDQDTLEASRVTTATSAEETETETAVSSTIVKRRPKNATNIESTIATAAGVSSLSKQPLASSFAKRCYFTKAGIGGHTQHYEGLTLTGNIILMLAGAMKLKGCPTICDEDLRRVEQTYPNQFSRLPDELLLSSGWRRISKYCHFSNKPIPDGIPFFRTFLFILFSSSLHTILLTNALLTASFLLCMYTPICEYLKDSRQRLHPSGGYYFLLASAVGMVRPIDVEPLNRDTLVLLETDYPTQCDVAPSILINDPDEWTVVDKFCFFSGGPINTDEDVYYMADFDGNPIYMLAFLSPSLTPSELYKLDSDDPLRSIAAVEEVESVYDLTERDFDDLKLYHLGPCRALYV